MAKQSENKTIKSLKAKIKKLEEEKELKLKALEKAPNIRGMVYGMTFAGLSYGYYTGAVKILPDFLFQFGDLVTKPMTDLYNTSINAPFVKEGAAYFGIRLERIEYEAPQTPMEAIQEGDNTIAKAQAAIDKERAYIIESREPGSERLARDLEEMDNAQRRLNEHKSKWDTWKFKTLGGMVLVAMGMAGATMLFLMETSASEVVDIAVKAADALTPLT